MTSLQTQSSQVRLPNGKAASDASRVEKKIVSYADDARRRLTSVVKAAVSQTELVALQSQAHLQVGYGHFEMRLFAWLCVAAELHSVSPEAIADRIVANKSSRGILL